MNGIKYGAYHSNIAWGLFLENWNISPPTPRRHKVYIPGRHGSLDVSKALTGELFYEDRTLTANFVMLGDREEWPGRYSEILQAIHGKEMNIYPDEDPDYFYFGFCEVTDFKMGKTHATITIQADVIPFKLEIAGNGAKL